jgi:hypothetical protein
MDAAAAFYAGALRLASVPHPGDEDHDGSGPECDAYWELSDEIEEAGADAGLTEAEMAALIAAADSEHHGRPRAGDAAIAALAAGRFGPELPS